MLIKKDIPYLVQLVNEDRREIMMAYKNNGSLEQAEMAGAVRERVIKHLNELYDSLNV